ncbi:TetR family transcriptional regulator [Arthrobacter sp. EH-1B-1]|uniref:TetR family transcriptional regulator n=1 Tax=Arthrobacter vasquezii TaxID=2977629 RepID=A0ABT6CPZ2_9MICC|nr:TetR family transcriptional regulator [Arthrobacter vasquezii]MDF9276216.1 TetR family transcriptional regulator [Arthrobacter vasquezii]
MQQIADRAGISSRTFFRYFTRKEHAALPGQHRMLAGVRAFETLASNPAEMFL